MLTPKKSLGQNFLIDKNICKKILNITNIYNKNIIEIGPGTGQLTSEIIYKKPKKILLIEKDKNLYFTLKNKYKTNKKITIINDDALKFDYTNYKNYIIISNLPYNISVKLIIHLIMKKNYFLVLILMLQKEVAEKLDYHKNKKRNKYNFLIEVTSNYSIEFNISNQVFYPKPKINSAVVKIIPKKNLIINMERLQIFAKNVFKYKRKKISNTLPSIKYNKQFEEIVNKRAEDLKTKELLILFDKF